MSGFDNEVLYAIGERLEPSSQQAIGLMQKGSSDVSRVNWIGTPEGFVSANPGSLSHDPSTGQVYIKQSGTGNTGWSQILTSTTGVLPVPNGGTGKSTFVPFSVVTGGTTTTTPLQQVSGVGTSGQVLTSNGAAQLPTWQNLSGGGFLWTDSTAATQALLVQNGYITDRGAGVTYTLPATASLGDTIKIVGKLGLATITPNANQQILIGSSSGAVGVTGTAVANNVGDCIELICITSGASTVWRSDSVIGTWTLTT